MPPAISEAIEQAAEVLRNATTITVLTGAGVSAESGVPTFRAADGLWEGHRIEDVASPSGFRRNPELVWNFYNQRRTNVRNVSPNPGHYALAELEKRWGDEFTVITQNVDGLHQQAGSKRVLEIHGSLHRTRCTECDHTRSHDIATNLPPMPKCEKCGGLLRPAIVWFGEGLDEEVWNNSVYAAATCDVLLVIGTSAVVYPAASLIPLAKDRSHLNLDQTNGKVIELNLAPTDASHAADVGIYAPSGTSLPEIVKLLK